MKYVLLETLSGKIILSLILLLLDIYAFSAIVVPTKVISNDTIWSTDTIKITSDVLIDEKATLTIRKGVVVEFLGAYSILVYGAINAQGANGDSIQFMVRSENERVGWKGIRIVNTKKPSSFSHCIFKHSQGGQGGVVNIQSSAALTIDNSSFSYNKANEGGAIFAENTPVLINGCRIFNNTSMAEGGGIYLVSCSSATISNSCIYSNSASGFGGGIYAESSYTVIRYNRIFNNSSQETRTGMAGGGGLALLFGSDMVLNNAIYNNETTLNGGGITNISGTGQFVNNTIANNKARQGGGISIIDANADIHNTIIWNNQSTLASLFKSHNLYINSRKESLFTSCMVRTGTDYMVDTEKTTAFRNTLSLDPLFLLPFEHVGNSSAVFDAAWYLADESPCIDAGNQSANYTNFDIDGNPRVANLSVDMGAHEYQLELEQSGEYNSDVVWYGKINVTGDVIIGSNAKLTIAPGTQVSFKGPYSILINGQLIAIGEAQKQIVFTRDVPKKNQYPDTPAEGWKGIRFNSNTKGNASQLEFCIIEYCNNISNAGSTVGGAITCYDGAAVNVKNSIVRYCGANNGGAIYATDKAEANFVNSLFYGNYALMGGVFNVRNAQLSVLNCTLYNNQADEGGGMYCMGSSPAIENSIFWKNSAKKGAQIYLSDMNSDPNISYSVIDKDLEGIEGPGSGNQYTGLYNSNMDKNPLFVNTGQDQFSIKTQSPCVNAGNPRTTPNTVGTIDLLGNMRFQKIVDMGACEYQEITVTRPISDLSLIANSGTYTIDLTPYFVTSGISNSIQFKIPEIIDTSIVTVKLSANILQITPKLNSSGIDTVVILAESAYGAEARDTFLVRVNYLTVTLSSPFNEYRFKLNEDQMLRWTAIPASVIALKGYYMKIAEVQGNQTPEQALASGNYWFADTVVSSANNTVELLINRKFPAYGRMAWQISALGLNNKVVGFSPILSFHGAPLLNMFYAGVNTVSVDTTIVHDPLTLAGNGSIIDPKKGIINFTFSNLSLKGENNAYYLNDGVISLPYNDTVTLTPEYLYNGSASLFIDSLFIDKSGYSLRSKAHWNIPISNSTQLIAPIARLSYNGFRLSGIMPLTNHSFTPDALPLAKMTIDNKSYLAISKNTAFSPFLQGTLIVPVSANLQNTTDSVGFLFTGVSTIGYFQGTAIKEKRLGLNNLTQILPVQYVADFSNAQSPKAYEPGWKGIMVNRFKVMFNDKNVDYPLLLKATDGILFDVVNGSHFIITSTGIDMSIDTTFRLSIPSKFDGFEGSIKSFRFKRPFNATVADEIRGGAIVPYVDDDFENSYVINFEGTLALPEMQPRITDFSFAPSSQKGIDKMQLISGNHRFEGVIDKDYRTIHFDIPDTVDIHSVFVYFTARGSRVVIAERDIVRDFSRCNLSFPTVLRVYSGNGTYSDYVVTVLKTVTGIEEAGFRMSVFPNPAKDYIKITGDNIEGSQLKVFDARGMLKATHNIETTETILPISSFARGVYILQIKRKDSVSVYRFIKE